MAASHITPDVPSSVHKISPSPTIPNGKRNKEMCRKQLLVHTTKLRMSMRNRTCSGTEEIRWYVIKSTYNLCLLLSLPVQRKSESKAKITNK